MRYAFAERCRDGRIPIVGTVVDESAGSSGTPFNWLRSGRELPRRAPEHGELDPIHLPDRSAVRDQCVLDGRMGDGTNMGIALSRVRDGEVNQTRTSRG